MARRKISSSDLIWIFHEKLSEYADQSGYRTALAIIRGDKGDWEVATQRSLPQRQPELAKRISAIEKQLRKQYVLDAE